jgi:hypothetical protein
MAVGNQQRREAPLTSLYGAQPVKDAPQGHAYDFVNCDALAERLTNDGNDVVSPSGARYKAIYLGGSSRSMTLAALRRIAALADRLWPGSASTAVGKGRVIASVDIDEALATLGIAADFRYTGAADGADIPFVHRKLIDGDSYFLVNRNNRKEAIEAHFRVTGKAPELWHAETGAFEDVSYRIAGGETVVPLSLDLGAAREVAEVRVNGALAGYAWHAPYTVEIGPFVKPGKNELEIRVANLWVNRLIRDADPAVKDKVTWTDQPTYRPDAPLRPSGLIGPVTLQGSRD